MGIVVPYSMLLEQFHSAPPGKLFCLHGSSAVFRLSLAAASRALAAGIPMTLVDGTNRFDVYYIADFARRLAGRSMHGRQRTPEEFLDNIFISRAFTCFQMEAVITDRLLPFVRAKHSPVVIVFGLLDTFYDDQAPLHEVRGSIERIILALQRLKQEHVSVLLASLDLRPASKERSGLFPRLAAAMDNVYTVGEEKGKTTIVSRRAHHGTHRTDIHDGSSAGDGKLDEVPAGAAEGGSGGAGRSLPCRAPSAGRQCLCRPADSL